MPKYFFNVENIPPAMEPVGQELANDEAAWREATIVAGEIFKDVDGRLRPDQQWGLEVANEGGKPLFLIQVRTKKME